jgi:hypothetical protein
MARDIRSEEPVRHAEPAVQRFPLMPQIIISPSGREQFQLSEPRPALSATCTVT